MKRPRIGHRPLPDQPQCFQRDTVAGKRCQHTGQFALDYHQPGAAIGEDVFELRPARGGIDRHCDGAEPAAAQHTEQQFGAIGAQDRNPVAGLHACLRERPGVSGGRRQHFGKRERRAADGHEAAISVARGLAREDCGYGALKRREQVRKQVRLAAMRHTGGD